MFCFLTFLNTFLTLYLLLQCTKDLHCGANKDIFILSYTVFLPCSRTHPTLWTNQQPVFTAYVFVIIIIIILSITII